MLSKRLIRKQVCSATLLLMYDEVLIVLFIAIMQTITEKYNMVGINIKPL